MRYWTVGRIYYVGRPIELDLPCWSNSMVGRTGTARWSNGPLVRKPSDRKCYIIGPNGSLFASGLMTDKTDKLS